jgi:hypothetical protein
LAKPGRIAKSAASFFCLHVQSVAQQSDAADDGQVLLTIAARSLRRDPVNIRRMAVMMANLGATLVVANPA